MQAADKRKLMFFGQSEVWTADKHPATGNLISAAYHLNMVGRHIIVVLTASLIFIGVELCSCQFYFMGVRYQI